MVPEPSMIEAALRLSETKFRRLFESSKDGIMILDGDTGRITDANPFIVEHLGYAIGEIIGRNLWEFGAFKDIAAAKFVLATLLDEDYIRYENLPLRSKDGRVLEVEFISSVYREGDKKVIQCNIRDITGRHVAEQAASEDSAKLHALVEQSIAGIYMLAGDGTVAYINSRFAQMLGYSPSEVAGRSLLQFVAEADQASVLQSFREVVSGTSSSDQLTVRIQRKDGTVMDVLSQASGATIRDQTAVIGVLIDISERRQSERAIAQLNRALRTLSAGSKALVHAGSEDELLKSMCLAVVQVGGYPLAWIGYAEHDAGKTLRPVAIVGAESSYVANARISWSQDNERGRGISGAAIRTGEIQVNQDLETDARMAPWRADGLAHGLLASLALPLKGKSGTFGVLMLYAREIDAFGPREVELFAELATDLSYGIAVMRDRIEHAAARVRLDRSLRATIEALAGMGEMRDAYTAGHQRRVAGLASAIAGDLGLSDQQIRGISLAATVHDIGKIVVPSEILSKPGRLNELEFKMIQAHVQAGYEILKDIEFPWPIAQIVLQHHERIDGSGYPNGLKGDAILIESRILAVADVVEAISAHRPYRAALGIDVALQEIEKGRGRTYDAAVVDACLVLFRQKAFRFE